MPQTFLQRSGSLFSSRILKIGQPATLVLILFGIGCSSTERGSDFDARPTRLQPASRSALIDGTLVTREDLWPLLAERAGAAGLEAIALDRAVAREADRAGVQVDEDDLKAERAIVERALAGVGLSDRQQRGRIVAEARARRGWGPTWFEGLLRRNALARKLAEAL